MNLTDEEIRIKVAEAMGLPKHARYYAQDHGGMRWWTYETRKQADWMHSHFGHAEYPVEDVWIPGMLPNYPEDLNACAEFEKTLTDKELWQIDAILFNLPDCRAPFVATARQRCLAYLKTKGILP